MPRGATPKTLRSSTLIPDALRCEYLVNPLGIGEPRPRLSWKLLPASGAQALRGLAQSACRIRVASSRTNAQAGVSDLWDSGKVESAQSLFVEYRGRPLVSGQRAWWTVQVWDQSGRASANSPPAFWEMGLLNRTEWQGQWIGSTLVGGPNTESPAPFFRKPFRLPPGKKIASARLYASALGLYEFRLNGQKVGDHVFPPFWTDYRKRVQYQVHDISNLLRAGVENVAGIILGDGWYCGYTGNTNRRQFYGDRPRALAQLAIQFHDGSSHIVATDDSWMTAAGPILASDFFMGESYDARRELAGWDLPGYREEQEWSRALTFKDPHVALVAMTGPPVRAIKELPPVSVRPVGNMEYCVDFGQNMVGRVRLKVTGPAGATVTLRFAEILDAHGKIYTDNLRSARQTDRYTLKGDPAGEIYESRFTFHGFRYVEVSKYPGTLTPDAITGIVLHSDMPQTGHFECSDPLVTQLQHNIEWGQRGNFVDVPTDCPQRNERLGWTGDAQVFARTAAFNFDVAGFFAKWTQDLRDSQGQLGGYPAYAPVPVIEAGIEKAADGGPAWADAGIICPWTMFQCFADRRLLERHYDSMVRFLDRMVETSEPFGMIRSHPDWKGWLGFGDWLSQDGKDGLFGNTPKDLIGTAFLAHDSRLLAAIARTLGKTSDAARFDRIAAKTVAAFRRRYVSADGLIVGHTQTAYILALHFDLLPGNLRPAAVDALVKNIRANANRLNTGFVGTPYLNHVLTAAGHLDLAYELLLQKNWPSWLYSVTQGATTIWERWDGWTHDKGFQSASMNSFNHYAYGAVGDWLYQIVAGIDTDPRHPGYQHLLLRPHPPISRAAGAPLPLTWAKASLETPHGKVESAWRLENGARTLLYEVTLPPNTTATLYLPTINAAKIKESAQPLSKSKGIKLLRTQKAHALLALESGHYRFESILND